MSKIALITGGASGLGLAVAKSLASQGWQISIADMNTSAGEAAAVSLSATFHKTDVTDYTSLSMTFDSTFKQYGHIDFVFANAGVIERYSFYAKSSDQGPPPKPDMLTLEVNLKAVIYTSYLAQHYFRLNPAGSSGVLISTGSVGSLYTTPFSPVYCAAKYGVLGFTRSVAKHLWMNDKIRANVICPGTMKTGLLNEKEWEMFGDTQFTPIEKVVAVVEILLDEEEAHWGKTVEISGMKHYFREQAEYCDEEMRKVIEVADADMVRE